ncbi:MAG: 4-(cytidine 5'-diphospho)-2-C-methyl-D-erythritol kinase [Clostridia bacterium]|nr:4-(cytidine 5'-diphospho)-2-C-methyl-D-erythritol kinase [Clostridia bacterium]
MERIEQAYAKLNLFLDVTGKRADGYHEIKSVMHSVTLADTVTVRATAADFSCITLKMENSSIPADERNLAYLAAEAFLEKTGITANVAIVVEKQIPAAAGLGGGSADAAAVLRALNAIFDHPLSTEALCALGATLGSDVPFCVLGGTMLCEGRGEVCTPYSYPEGYFVIAVPEDEKMKTPEAYALLDEAFENFEEPQTALHEMLFSFFEEDPYYSMYNVFEGIVLPRSHAATILRTRLLDAKAKNAMMSGSGTAVFGVFDTEDEAKAAAAKIKGAIVCASAPASLTL